MYQHTEHKTQDRGIIIHNIISWYVSLEVPTQSCIWIIYISVYKHTHTHIFQICFSHSSLEISFPHVPNNSNMVFSKQKFLEYSIWCLKSNFLNLVNSTSLFSFPFLSLPCYYCWNSSISDLLLHPLHLKCRQLSLSICFLCPAFAFLLLNSLILQIPLPLYSNSPMSTGPPGAPHIFCGMQNCRHWTWPRLCFLQLES